MVGCVLLIFTRLEEEAQKRADAENNLVSFRKVNAHWNFVLVKSFSNPIYLIYLHHFTVFNVSS